MHLPPLPGFDQPRYVAQEQLELKPFPGANDRTRRVQSSVRFQAGQVLIQVPDAAILERFCGWIDHMNMGSLIYPCTETPQQATEGVWHVPDRWTRLIGTHGAGSRIYGLYLGDIVIARTDDAHVMAHELAHRRFVGLPKIMDEALAVSVGVLGFGSGQVLKDIIYGNPTYKGADQYLPPMLDIAYSVGSGFQSFIDRLKEYALKPGTKLNYQEFIFLVNQYLEGMEKIVSTQGISAEDYLVRGHRLTPKVAQIALETTGIRDEEVVRCSPEVLRHHLDAFKALVTFYHIQLGVPLETAIKRVEQHFERDEAIALGSTIFDGPQEVWSLLNEAGTNPDIVWRLSYAMIGNGPAFAAQSKKELPQLVRIASDFGPNGGGLLEKMTNHRDATRMLIAAEAFSGMLGYLTRGGHYIQIDIPPQPRLAREVLDRLYSEDYIWADYFWAKNGWRGHTPRTALEDYYLGISKISKDLQSRVYADAIYLGSMGGTRLKYLFKDSELYLEYMDALLDPQELSSFFHRMFFEAQSCPLEETSRYAVIINFHRDLKAAVKKTSQEIEAGQVPEKLLRPR